MSAIVLKKMFVISQRFKIIILLLFVICSFYILLGSNTKTFDPRICFNDRYLGEILDDFKLEDILSSKKKPTPGKTIFFHETSCIKNGEVYLNPRQACAIESAALLNPNWDIYVLFTSPVALPNSSVFLQINAILDYPNVNLRYVNLWNYAAETPIYEWLKDGELFKSHYVLSHISDFLRYLTLWKWGGTYLDLDVVLRKTLENIPSNYAGAESDSFVAAGVLNFDNKNFGHEIADMCLRNFQNSFNGQDWGNNGPGVITRVLHTVCKTKSIKLMTKSRCLGFKVFEQNAFYAVKWKNWNYFFDPKTFNKTMNIVRDSTLIHVWNKHSKNKLIEVGSKVAYGVIAEKYCPKVYKSIGKFF